MLKKGILSLVVLVSAFLTPINQPGDLLSPQPDSQEIVLAEYSLDLATRAPSQAVNEVFKFNILLAVEKFDNGFTLEPDEVFAFHENVLLKYRDRVVKTMGSRFIASEGYRSSGWVVGDGVCHLASLINWTTSEAGLETVARVSHSFRSIPGVPKEYWTSIRYCQSGCNSQNQNLYVINNFDYLLYIICSSFRK